MTAVHESSQEVLREVLASELADKLAQQIAERVGARIEPLVAELFGVEPSKRRLSKAKRDKPGEIEPEPDAPSEAA